MKKARREKVKFLTIGFSVSFENLYHKRSMKLNGREFLIDISQTNSLWLYNNFPE